jgi:predicted PurR-regulated permease PerM
MLMTDLDRNMNAYFRGQALVASIVGILFAIGFQIIGLPMGIGIGLIIGVLNLVPYMQALGIPPCILLGLIQSAETGRPVWVVMLCIAAVFIVVQSIQDMVLVPKIMGNVTGMGPAWILLSLSIWGSLLGIIGMIIALPLTTLLVSYYKRFVLHLSDDMTRTLPRSSWNIPFLKRKNKK